MVAQTSAYVHRSQLTDTEGLQTEGVNKVALYVWDSVGLSWIKATSTGGGGGGGGPVTIVDGGDVTQGAILDAGVVGDVSGTVSAKLRGINKGVAATVGLGLAQFDAASLSQNTTQDIWTFYVGGLIGALVNTVTITYTSTTKATIQSVVKT
jgi:hypothetical protein